MAAGQLHRRVTCPRLHEPRRAGLHSRVTAGRGQGAAGQPEPGSGPGWVTGPGHGVAGPAGASRAGAAGAGWGPGYICGPVTGL